uniref:Uncharacterized protein n=1 Tax=viral metagenome TaxID=1070528 RepID=A0A6C0CM53_9ZZZZ
MDNMENTIVEKLSENEYYKWTNKSENHHGYQYKDGFNVNSQKFEYESECYKGLFFCDLSQILEWLDKAESDEGHLRIVRLTEIDEMYKRETHKGKYKAHRIYLGEKMSVVEGLKYLKNKGATLNDSLILKYASKPQFANTFSVLTDIIDYKSDLSVPVYSDPLALKVNNEAIFKMFDRKDELLKMFPNLERLHNPDFKPILDYSIRPELGDKKEACAKIKYLLDLCEMSRKRPCKTCIFIEIYNQILKYRVLVYNHPKFRQQTLKKLDNIMEEDLDAFEAYGLKKSHLKKYRNIIEFLSNTEPGKEPSNIVLRSGKVLPSLS